MQQGTVRLRGKETREEKINPNSKDDCRSRDQTGSGAKDEQNERRERRRKTDGQIVASIGGVRTRREEVKETRDLDAIHKDKGSKSNGERVSD